MKIDGSVYREKTVYLSEENICLRYYLYTSLSHDGTGRRLYHMEITLTSILEKECCSLQDIATSLGMAERIWDLFTRELVTPVTAQDILEQLLSQTSFLYEE